jgi:hypothetical protein
MPTEAYALCPRRPMHVGYIMLLRKAISALIRVNPPTSAVKKINPKFPHRTSHITKTLNCQINLNFAYNS